LSVWHPFTQHGLCEPIGRIARAEGAILHTADGRRIIDGISSWWVTTHGHCHPRIVTAIADQASRLDQLIFAGWTHEPAEMLADRLLALLPVQCPHVFYSDSGSTSVEVALKMALGFWANRGEARSRIVVMDKSYHGDTVGAMSVGARSAFNLAYEPLLFEVERVPYPASGREQDTLDALDVECRRGDVAAFLIEPLILGAGGMLLYPASLLAEMRRMCGRHGVLFIADEVMTGWGRTGTLLASEQAGISPDLLCLSKGLTGGSLPLAVTLASDAVFDAHWSKDRAKQLFHSSSYTANPIACAAAAANLDIWNEEPVLERVRSLGARLAERLVHLGELPGASNLRQLGTIVALDVGAGNDAGYLSRLAPEFLKHFRESDTTLRPLGNTIYLMPPYCIGDADLDRLFEIVADAVERFGSTSRLASRRPVRTRIASGEGAL
jgi:adenosylmethionine-8-amino-7-oxononanoate aminotransferase